MKKKKPPIAVIPREELELRPNLKEGDLVQCHHCNSPREVFYGETTDGRKASLMFYKCGKYVYLAGADGKSWI